MIDLITGLRERCDKHRQLETIRKRIASAKVAYTREKKDKCLLDIEKDRYALEYVLSMLVDMGGITEAERDVVERYYGCYDRA